MRGDRVAHASVDLYDDMEADVEVKLFGIPVDEVLVDLVDNIPMEELPEDIREELLEFKTAKELKEEEAN